MRLLLYGLALVLAGGCTAGVSTPLIGLRGSIDMPFLEKDTRLPVVYPVPAGGHQPESLEERYGPAWKDVQGQYPDLQFN